MNIEAGQSAGESNEATVILLAAAAGGDAEAEARLLPMVYDQLRKLAQVQMGSERANHTLSATALVHEAYLKLAGPREVPWANRGHYYAAAAEAMRRILIDWARSKATLRRDDTEARAMAASMTGLPNLSSEMESAGFLILNDALCRLEVVDPQAAAVVRLRFFAGLSVQETAAALGQSEPTVKRTWAFARSWLKQRIEAGLT